MFEETSPYSDPAFETWQQRLRNLSPEAPHVRVAMPTVHDGQSMRWLQMTSQSMYIHSVGGNITTITKKLVLLAEIANYPVGFCVAAVGRYAPEYLFIQRVAVDPLVRRRGIGVALLRAAVREKPDKHIAGATLDDDAATHALNQKLATSLGATVEVAPHRRFTRTDLSLGQGEIHRPWVIKLSKDSGLPLR